MKQMIRPLMAAMRAQGRLPKPTSLTFQAQPHKKAVPKPRRKPLLKEAPSLLVPIAPFVHVVVQNQEEEEESEGELVQEASDEEAVFISEADALP